MRSLTIKQRYFLRKIFLKINKRWHHCFAWPPSPLSLFVTILLDPLPPRPVIYFLNGLNGLWSETKNLHPNSAHPWLIRCQTAILRYIGNEGRSCDRCLIFVSFSRQTYLNYRNTLSVQVFSCVFLLIFVRFFSITNLMYFKYKS